MVIDKNISIAHFKEMITKLLSSLLHKNVETRMRPGYFPFVEPGFEIDVRYDIYNQETGTMEKSKRMEILGAGMIHPNVLKTAGIDVSD
jgi:phenylalanyl-tRNA synthetase alpha chain